MALTILEGSTFCICEARGDFDGDTQGLFADDTRFRSLLRLTVNGAKPLLLSSGVVEYFSAAFYLRNPPVGGLPHDTVSITRHRFVGEGMQDLIVVQNQGMEPLSFDVALELGTDFADILTVKEHDFALGDPVRAKPLPAIANVTSLRLGGGGRAGRLPAAGMPWFMTVFGRDTIITWLQTLLFGPELARTALDVLAELQATEDNAEIDAEPGKIVHELRSGKAAQNWFHTYYGTADATPLYLILLSEVWRWTDDSALVRTLKEPALRALGWIDQYGDRDGDGFVEYERRTPHGLANQSWKDSGDSQRFQDGSLAPTPIAPVEVQGYVYDAKLRTAELAREVWRDPPPAERPAREAAEWR